MNESVKDRYPEIYRDIERMAFNVHLIWQKDPNADYAKVKKEFQIKYNHDSCVANVISMKYKLHGMGLELNGNYGDVANDYYGKYNRTDKEFKNEMNRIEHKRWVTEKICLGWKHRDIDDCLTGKTKDDKKKEHICILKSRAEDPFFDKEWEDGNKWDNATKYDLEKLDDLDKMTVMLYRKLKEKANVINESKLNEIKNQIKQIVENNRRTFVAFLEWDSCIKDVLGNDKKRAAMYGGLRDSFIAAADDLSDIDREAVSFRVHEFDEMIYPKIACLKRHVWKKDDEDLVKNIPFILTYSSDIYLAIPYCAGITADELFRNVAAPTAAKPSGIIYLYRVKDKRDVLNLDDSFVFIKSYLTKKKLRAKVEFAILCEDEKLAGKIASGGIGGAKATCFSSGRDIVSWLKKRSKKHDLLAYEFNGSNFIHSGVEALPSYEFDSKKAAFCELSSCDALKHIGSKPKPYITVSDMFSLSSSSSTSTNNPLFFEDYRKLWSIYTGFNKSKFQYSLAWKKLCKLLGDYFRKKDQLVELEFNKKADVVKTTNYTIDISCMKSVEKLIGKLKDKCVLNEESGVFCQNDNRCKVFISDPYDNIEKYNDLFNNKMSFLKCADDVDAVISFEDGKKKCVIVNETLEVKGINLNELSDKNNAKFTNTNISTARNILENLNKPENGFIRNLSEKPTDIKSGGTQSAPERSNIFGFTISTKEIKDILTVEGRMLEVYVYHKLKESGAFDDVVSSYEVNLEEKEVKNEFDCIATKGFGSLIIECKARKQIEAEFLYKINALALHFGVNAKTVLIAETNEWTDKNDNTANDMQRIRADIMNIEVICNNNDIENIGDSLSRIIRQ